MYIKLHETTKIKTKRSIVIKGQQEGLAASAMAQATQSPEVARLLATVAQATALVVPKRSQWQRSWLMTPIPPVQEMAQKGSGQTVPRPG